MLRTVVCDDEEPALELMSELLRETGRVDIVAACQSASDAIERINRGGIDLAVFDIEMPSISGVKAYDQLTIEPKPLLIFATAHAEYAVDAFGVDAIDYLMKPLDLERVSRAVEKAERLSTLIAASKKRSHQDDADRFVLHQAGVLKVRDGGHVYFIPYEEVQWIEAAGDYSLVHTRARDYAMRATIRSLEEQLPQGRFLRIHRSTIIAPQHVREVHALPKGEAQIVLASGTSVKASRSYREAVRSLTAGAG